MNFIFLLAVFFFLDVHLTDGENLKTIGNQKPVVGNGQSVPENWFLNIWPPSWLHQQKPNYHRPSYPKHKPLVLHFCPYSVKDSFCSKNTSFIYKVLALGTNNTNETTYIINITRPFVGVSPSYKNVNVTLVLPKNNTKHTIKVNQTYLYMCSNGLNNSQIVLDRYCYNKPVSSLSLSDIRFLENKGYKNQSIYSWFCLSKENKEKCKVRNCYKKCNNYCKNCDDERGCEDECKKRCEVYYWYQDKQGNSYSYRAIDDESD